MLSAFLRPFKLPGFQVAVSTVRPSRVNHSQTSGYRTYVARQSKSHAPIRETSAANFSLRRSTAQAIRANVLVRATTATFLCTLANRLFAQRPSAVSFCARCERAARAPWISSFRRYLFPRLLMPRSFGLLPVVDCLG